MKRDAILILAMLSLSLVVSQAQDCLPKLIKASNDTTFIVDDSNLLLIERPTDDDYIVTMNFVRRVIEPVITIVNDDKLTYTGAWVIAEGATYSVTYSSDPGAVAKYSFTGNRVEVISDLAPNHGELGYTINSGKEKIVNLYSAVRQNGVVVIEEPVPAGFNTITLRCVSNTVLIDYLRLTK